jgi:nucleoside phosphorylase
MAAAAVMLDEIHGDLSVPSREINSYILGVLGKHNIVITCPSGMGNISAAGAVVRLLDSFPSIRFGLLVGIGGGIPNSKADIRLGDVVVSKPTGTYGGVVQYGFGKAVEGGFEPVGSLPQPPPVLLAAVTKLEAFHLREESRIPEFLHEMEKNLGPKKALKFTRPLQEDRLFQSTYSHIQGAKTCDFCETAKIVQRTSRETDEPGIHYGLIASGNVVVKDSNFRDQIKQDRDYTPYCVEMEAAGVMNYLPCLVIRGICDYADSHKNDAWQGYAAAVAAAFSKELLTMVDDENMAIARLSGFGMHVRMVMFLAIELMITSLLKSISVFLSTCQIFRLSIVLWDEAMISTDYGICCSLPTQLREK